MRPELIIQLRKEQNLSQEELASILGISRKTIIRWEHGEREPKATEICNLAKALNVTVAFLMGEESNLRVPILEKSEDPMSSFMLLINQIRLADPEIEALLSKRKMTKEEIQYIATTIRFILSSRP